MYHQLLLGQVKHPHHAAPGVQHQKGRVVLVVAAPIGHHHHTQALQQRLLLCCVGHAHPVPQRRVGLQ